MASSNKKSQIKLKQKIKKLEQKNENLEKQRMKAAKNAKRQENIVLAKKSAYVCSIIALVVILFVYLFSAFAMSESPKGSLFSKEMLAVENKEGKWGYINKTGQTMIDFEYDYAFNFSDNGLALVGKDDKFGFINLNGKVVIDIEYDYAIPFENDVSIVSKGGKYGVINSRGKIVTVNPKNAEEKGLYYESIKSFVKEPVTSNIYAIAVFNGLYGLINTKGEIVLDFKYEELANIGNGYVAYREDDKWGYVGYDGTPLTKSLYLSVGAFDKNGFAIASYESGFDDENYVILNSNGKWVYDDISISKIERINSVYFKVLTTDGKYGILDNKLNEYNQLDSLKIETKYTYLEKVSEELLAYSTNTDELNRKYGLIDFEGNVKTEEIYVSVKSAGDKLVAIKEDDDKFIIFNLDLSQSFEFECDKIYEFHYGVAVFEIEGKFGYVDENGEIVHEANLIFASDFKADGFAVARDDENGYGVLKKNGKWMINPKYLMMVYGSYEELLDQAIYD